MSLNSCFNFGGHSNMVQWFDGLDRERIKTVIEFAARGLDKAAAFGPQS